MGRIEHPAKELLDQFRTEGASVQLQTPPWPKGKLDAALRRGPHKSAKDNIAFLRSEFADMINKGHWTLLPVQLVDGRLVLRVSPLGVVPQRDLRPRTICDYTYFGVNDDIECTAPAEAMQFGRALQRVLSRTHHSNPKFSPVYLSKIDIADGFYRVWVKSEDIPNLSMLFPNRPGEPQLLGFPLTLPMGLKESPPYFCAITETVTDLANSTMATNVVLPAHRRDTVSKTPPKIEPAVSPTTTLQLPPPLVVPMHQSTTAALLLGRLCG